MRLRLNPNGTHAPYPVSYRGTPTGTCFVVYKSLIYFPVYHTFLLFEMKLIVLGALQSVNSMWTFTLTLFNVLALIITEELCVMLGLPATFYSNIKRSIVIICEHVDFVSIKANTAKQSNNVALACSVVCTLSGSVFWVCFD